MFMKNILQPIIANVAIKVFLKSWVEKSYYHDCMYVYERDETISTSTKLFPIKNLKWIQRTFGRKEIKKKA